MKMKIKDVIKRGILTGDWDLICKAYTGMTGEKISPPVHEMEIDIDQSRQNISQNIPQNISQKNIPQNISQKNISPNITQNTQQDMMRRTPINMRQHNNMFVDDFSQARQDLKSSRDMSKLYNDHLTERRPPSQLVNVRCGCGQIDQVLPEIASQYLVSAENGGSEYKCQRCIKK